MEIASPLKVKIYVFHNMPPPYLVKDEDIVCAISNNGIRDERTGVNAPLVYQLFYQGHCWVAMCGPDKR
jgi:hypothetical protein